MREMFYPSPVRRTIRELLDESAALWPEGIALRSREQRLTYRALQQAVQQNALRLTSAVPAGRVILLSRQRRITLETALSLLTLMYAGRCAVMMPDFATTEAVAATAARYGASAIISDAFEQGALPLPVLPLGVLPEGAQAELLPEVSPEDECMVLFTSGTTAEPKGAVITQWNLCADAAGGSRIYPFFPGQRFVNCLPYYHGYGVLCDVIAPLMGGACLCTASEEGLIRDVQHFRPTNINGVPEVAAVLLQMLSAFGPEAAGGELRSVLCGGAALDPALGQGLEEFGVGLYNCYGLTEFSTAIAVNSPRNNDWSSVGLVLPCCEVMIASDGEVLVRGDNMMKGYGPDGPWLARDVWFHTGDVGSLDTGGRLYISGRKDNVINLPNGEKIQPEQYEARLKQLGGVKEAVVYQPTGRPWLTAVVVPSGDSEAAGAAVAALNAGVSADCRLVGVRFTAESLVRNALGKIQRRHYRESE
ncbi:MAG: AMP-binding protein [Clostridia bacterium]|nr:AMP-binding protein [Clostridia bacterium]